MRYDLLAQDALRGVVRQALRRAGREGLPGDHHFFIAIDTRHPGVRISPRLRGRYPEEITIVLQHQFWNLDVQEERFEVDLSFDNVQERLIVPFSAVKGFFDPSVQFGLQFEVATAAQAADDAEPEQAESPASAEKDEETTGEPEAPKVVSLDTFRKKS
ncbi:MAG: SspB family protein [Parvibaculaceae bacterium]